MKHFAIGALAICALLGWTTSANAASYADDRAEIENLMAIYLFALDDRDADTYAETFTEKGVLNYGGGVAKGREAIRAMVKGLAERAAEAARENPPAERPIPTRHIISNIIIEIDGDTATSRSYWTHFAGSDERTAIPTSYGRYDDRLVRVDGKWLFTSRVIYNEYREGRQEGVLVPDISPD